MRPDCVVVLTPLLDEDLRLFERAENFSVEEFISEFTVEAFIVPILPGTAGFDKERMHANPLEPFPQGYGDKLWPVVRTDVSRHTMLEHSISNRVKDVA